MKTKRSIPVEYSWIDLLDPLSVDRWTNRLKVSEAELRTIVRTQGGQAAKVETYLSKRKIFPDTSKN